MTDNEIIKALEWCSKGNDCQRCEYQPTKYRKGTIGCSMQLKEDALDLITRQKAEIESLTKKYEMAVAEREANVKGFTTEIERLSKVRCHFPNDNYCKVVEVNEENEILKEENKQLIFDLKTAKAEAIKEFDERLKEDCLSYPLEKDDKTMLVDVDSYNNLAKEMVGDSQ